ncbi:hypothetical protein EDM80_09350 [bacterium]|nr:MAG: hypothetical protein EDM80_09350 [bacterium]RIK63065.1 MAG: hypothetical protein DCC64_08340 [Planctomycetota bacterium]
MLIPVFAANDAELVKVFDILKTIIREEVARSGTAQAVTFVDRMPTEGAEGTQGGEGAPALPWFQSVARVANSCGSESVATLAWNKSKPEEVRWEVTTTQTSWDANRFREGWHSVSFFVALLALAAGCVAHGLENWSSMKSLLTSKEGWIAGVLVLVGLFFAVKFSAVPYIAIRQKSSERIWTEASKAAQAIEAAGQRAVNNLLTSQAGNSGNQP